MSLYTASDIAKKKGVSARLLNKKLLNSGIVVRDSERNITIAAEEYRYLGKLAEETLERSDGRKQTYLVWKWDEFGKDLILTELRDWKPK